MAELDTNALSEALGVEPDRIDAWRKEGLPCIRKGRSFIFHDDAVRNWLVENGHAQTDDQKKRIARTRDEVADHFDVHLRTVAGWLKRSDFPGKSGDKHLRNGYFPLDEIDQWLRDNNLGPYQAQHNGDRSAIELRELRIAHLKTDLEKKCERLIEREAVTRFIASKHAQAIHAIKSLPSLLVGLLPPDMDERIIADFHTRAKMEVKRAFDAISSLYDSEDDDLEDID